MTRFMPLAAAILAAFALTSASARAAEGAWCAVYSIQGGGVREDCQWRTIEECRRVIVAGDRGTCNMNPRYTGDATTKKPKPKN